MGSATSATLLPATVVTVLLCVIDPDATDYILSVSFDSAGQLSGVDMES